MGLDLLRVKVPTRTDKNQHQSLFLPALAAPANLHQSIAYPPMVDFSTWLLLNSCLGLSLFRQQLRKAISPAAAILHRATVSRVKVPQVLAHLICWIWLPWRNNWDWCLHHWLLKFQRLPLNLSNKVSLSLRHRTSQQATLQIRVRLSRILTHLLRQQLATIVIAAT